MRIRRGRPKGVRRSQSQTAIICLSCNLIQKKLSHYAFLLNATALFIFQPSVSYADSSPIKGATDNP